MRRAVLMVLMGLVLVVGGCKMEIEDNDSDKRPAAHVKGKRGPKSPKGSGGSFRFHSGKGGTSISIVDGDDVVELHAGGDGAHIKVKSGEDSVVLKADKIGADIRVDDSSDTVQLRANAKGARILVKSGKDSVTLNADDLHGAIKIKQRQQRASGSPARPKKTQSAPGAKPTK